MLGSLAERCRWPVGPAPQWGQHWLSRPSATSPPARSRWQLTRTFSGRQRPRRNWAWRFPALGMLPVPSRTNPTSPSGVAPWWRRRVRPQVHRTIIRPPTAHHRNPARAPYTRGQLGTPVVLRQGGPRQRGRRRPGMPFTLSLLLLATATCYHQCPLSHPRRFGPVCRALRCPASMFQRPRGCRLGVASGKLRLMAPRQPNPTHMVEQYRHSTHAPARRTEQFHTRH